jgi:hypothetical protein
MRRDLRHRLPYLAAALGFVGVFVFALRGFLVGELFPIWDAESLLAPYYMLISDFARAGELLWWNPWANAGQPDFVDPQYGAHNPLVLVLAWLFGPSLHGFIAYWFAIWLVFGIGIMALARHWRIPAWGGFVVALGLTFSGFFLGHAEHTPIVFSWAFIPLVVWRIEVAVARASWRPAAQAGVLFGLSALGGYPAVLLTNGLFLAGWMVMRGFVREETSSTRVDPSRRLATTATIAVVVFSIAVVIALPTFFGFFHEGRPFTNRVSSLSRSVATSSNALHPLALLTFASPFLANLPPDRLWTYTDSSSASCYMGGLVFAFALFSLLARPRSHLRWLLLGAAALATAAAMGSELPVRGWLYDWVPFTRFFRHSSLFRAYPLFLLGILALFGARDYLGAVPGVHLRRRLAAASVIGLAAAAFAYAFLFARANPIEPKPIEHGPADLHLIIAWVGPALVATSALFDRVGKRRGVVVFAMVALAVADVVMGAGLAWTLGNRAKSARAEWKSMAAQHRGGLDLLRLDGADRTLEPSGIHDNRSFHARKAALRSYSGLRSYFHEQWNANPTLVAAATTSNRFWFSSEAVWLPLCERSFLAFVSRTDELGAAPLVLHDRSWMTDPGACAGGDLQRLQQAPPAERIAITLQQYVPDAMTLRLDAPRDGWLLVTDRWAPGWKARVNGKATPVQGADFLFRALPVQTGRNRIELTYQPLGYPWSPLATWLFIAAVLVASFWPRKTRTATPV